MFNSPVTALSKLSKTAKELEERINGLPEVSQSFVAQEADYPTLNIKVDRVRAARLGVAQQKVIQNVITALDSNLYIKPSIWIDHANKDDYFLTVQYPGSEKGFDSLEVLQNIPIETVTRENGHAQSLLLRDVATISPEFHPSEADHYSIQRVVDLLVAPSTEDLGGTQAKIQDQVDKMTLPPGISVRYRGAVASMQKSFASFGFGLSLAVILLYLVMVAQFRSFLDPLIIMFAVPMGLIGVIWTLWLTGTTLNIESFMGIIVMVGIVVSNSILLVDFANERRRQGQELRRAAIESARIRMRPILMTALATVAGLMPIAMKLGEGSEASAPLARAAVGGLIVSTFLTLFLVPCVYEYFYRRLEGDAPAPRVDRKLMPMLTSQIRTADGRLNRTRFSSRMQRCEIRQLNRGKAVRITGRVVTAILSIAVLWTAGCDAPVIPMTTTQKPIVDVIHPRPGRNVKEH